MSTDSDNLVQLRELKPRPEPSVVNVLRDLLARAEAGDILAIAVATHLRENRTGSAWSLGKDGDVAHLVCAIERVKARLLQIGQEDDE